MGRAVVSKFATQILLFATYRFSFSSQEFYDISLLVERIQRNYVTIHALRIFTINLDRMRIWRAYLGWSDSLLEDLIM
jgi:hypothetical protein